MSDQARYKQDQTLFKKIGMNCTFEQYRQYQKKLKAEHFARESLVMSLNVIPSIMHREFQNRSHQMTRTRNFSINIEEASEDIGPYLEATQHRLNILAGITGKQMILNAGMNAELKSDGYVFQGQSVIVEKGKSQALIFPLDWSRPWPQMQGRRPNSFKNGVKEFGHSFVEAAFSMPYYRTAKREPKGQIRSEMNFQTVAMKKKQSLLYGNKTAAVAGHMAGKFTQYGMVLPVLFLLPDVARIGCIAAGMLCFHTQKAQRGQQTAIFENQVALPHQRERMKQSNRIANIVEEIIPRAVGLFVMTKMAILLNTGIKHKTPQPHSVRDQQHSTSPMAKVVSQNAVNAYRL